MESSCPFSKTPQCQNIDFQMKYLKAIRELDALKVNMCLTTEQTKSFITKEEICSIVMKDYGITDFTLLQKRPLLGNLSQVSSVMIYLIDRYTCVLPEVVCEMFGLIYRGKPYRRYYRDAIGRINDWQSVDKKVFYNKLENLKTMVQMKINENIRNFKK